MTKGTWMIGFAAGVVMVAGSDVALAQYTGTQTQQPPMQQPSQMQPQSQGTMQSAQTIPINGHFAYSLVNGCNYQADVRGSARGSASGGEPQYAPNVMIDASVVCPNQTTIRTTDRIVNETPMTLAKLEQMLELRASLITDNSGMHCAYVPDFRLSANQLQGVGAALLCPLPATSVRGGGPGMQQSIPQQLPQGQQFQQQNAPNTQQ